MRGSGSVFQIQIRTQEAPEYGSNTDTDPQHWLTLNSKVTSGHAGTQRSTGTRAHLWFSVF